MKAGLKFNWWVVLGIVALAAVLGAVNNHRVYPEQRVALFGAEVEEE